MSLANYQKYEKYIDSGFDPIGNVPAHWDLLPNRYIFTSKKRWKHHTQLITKP